MEFDFNKIEEEARAIWRSQNVYRVENDISRPKYYVLDMFPYPSGAGLHVGHPLGYIASDIFARYKRLRGFNVLHTMGYDSFGLPAEQYAIQTGQHPAITTEQNINRFREQLDKMGFSFDWSRQLRTSDPGFYKWTQWIFIQLFKSFYNKTTDKAESIESLIAEFEKNGNANVNAHCDQKEIFSAAQWNTFSENDQQTILLNYRLAYIADSWVNWCPALGTVLANDEVKDGVSERGGYPVIQKQMKQWSLRITAYSERLLQGLEKIDWSESIKETQRNWIGKSEGASVDFLVLNSQLSIQVFTTRPDTIFGCTFLVLAPENKMVDEIATLEFREAVNQYREQASRRSERERNADVKTVSGQFTGAFAIHPFTKKQLPIYIADYVLATYGTGAVMAVPGGDQRDFRFAKLFDLPIIQIIKEFDVSKESYEGKDGTMINSDFLNGMTVTDATKKIIAEIEKLKIGKGKIQYRQRDAIFGRQRYWGEPIPIYYRNGLPYPVDEKDLPVILPEVDKYLPTEDGEPPLKRAKNWKYKNEFEYELTTMPGWAGSCWYYLRYGDPNNEIRFASEESIDYWKNIDLYIGGHEHAAGHLIYFRFWTKFLFDLGLIPFDEPAKKLVNQGMITAMRYAVYIDADETENYLRNQSSITCYGEVFELKRKASFILRSDIGNKSSLYVNDLLGRHKLKYLGIPDLDCIEDGFLNIYKFKLKLPEYTDAVFITPLGYYQEDTFTSFNLPYERTNINPEDNFVLSKFSPIKFGIEKMSKSKGNVVSPDDVISGYGADCFRLYEMFLGPLETDKPWDTKGIDGVYRFIKKLWRLFFDEEKNVSILNDEKPTDEELKILHRTIKKVGSDINQMSFNTSVSAFMVCVNELSSLKCNKKSVLRELLILLSPFAPFISEFLWKELGEEKSIVKTSFPVYNEKYVAETVYEYPVSVNGKVRAKISLDLNLDQAAVEKEVLAIDSVQKWLNGNAPKKIIYVKGRMINLVV
jgi:leucyl-tRNA synthetase